MIRLPTAFTLLALTAGASTAADQEQLEQRGFRPVWQGYASIETCVHDEDRHQLGHLIFVCDQHTFAYPYHYGEASLLAAPGQAVGYLCLNEEDECLVGTIAAQ